jgi:general stress protein 26
MASWGEMAQEAPKIASVGRDLLYRSGHGSGLLATVRDGGIPRIHPISVGIVGDHLVAFIIRSSPKTRDLELDGRYSLHAHMDLSRPNELEVRGHARAVTDQALIDQAAAGWNFEVDDDYRLFEFDIETALLGERATGHDWPPAYTRWSAAG